MEKENKWRREFLASGEEGEGKGVKVGFEQDEDEVYWDIKG